MQRKFFEKGASCGMSLVELMLVMAILSVVMMAVMSLFIPAQRSTVVQTQVTDVQANLRLAMNRLSQDLLTAGFLVTGPPVIFESGTNDDPVDFTIRTRLTGQGFGRVGSVTAGSSDVRLNLTSPDMAAEFPVNSQVRLIEPVTTAECDETAQPDASKRVYTVVASSVNNNGTPADATDDFAVIDLDDLHGSLAVGDVTPETVVIKVADNTRPAIQTIRYQFADSNGDGTADALLRIVNGEIQYLARNVSAANFAYAYTPPPGNKVRRVDIMLAGQTRELVANDAIAGAKTRALQTSVTLRNVF